MRLAYSILATLSLVGAAGLAGAAPALDAAGKCRDNGKFVDQKLCTTSTATATHCRDIKTKKFAKCGTPGTEPVPAAK